MVVFQDRWVVALLLTAAQTIFGAEAEMPTAAGRWQATVSNPSGELVAFGLEVTVGSTPAASGDAGLAAHGALVNGDERVPSSDGTFDPQTHMLTLHFDFFDAVLHAQLTGDALHGSFDRQWQNQKLTRVLQAVRATTRAPAPSPTPATPDLTGEWVLKVGEGESQRLWRALLRTAGGEVTGTIIPVSGDWGAFTGALADDGTLTLSHFDGINSRVLRVTLQPDGTLIGMVDLGLFDPVRKVVAERVTTADAALVAALPDADDHTRMRNPEEPFRFSYPDLEGNVVAWDDARFRGKVVIVSIMGTWCPACHEDSPFLQELYARYRDRGLEVVGLAFEYTGDVERDRRQVRIFARRHGIRYPLLLAGDTRDAAEKMSQLENFGAFPTAIFIGRDGLVQHVHTGFEGQATGERGVALKREIEALVRDLLGLPPA